MTSTCVGTFSICWLNTSLSSEFINCILLLVDPLSPIRYFAGIYLGGNKVVHFTREENKVSTGGFSISFSSTGEVSSLYSAPRAKELPACLHMPDCGFRQPQSGVVLSCLDCFLGG